VGLLEAGETKKIEKGAMKAGSTRRKSAMKPAAYGRLLCAAGRMICLKRLRRIAWSGLVIVSSLLCIATVAIWSAGGWADKSGRFHSSPLLDRWEFAADGSVELNDVKTLQLVIIHVPNTQPEIGPKWGPTGASSPAMDVWLNRHREFVNFRRIGFGISMGQQIGGEKGGNVIAYGTRLHLFAPYWGVVVLLAIPSLIAILLKNKNYFRSGKPALACLVCGYDLRATPDRCPECGTMPAEKTLISK
jgi:hypothetical protein